jgi:hypothetical protein
MVHAKLSERSEYVREGNVYSALQIDVGLVRPGERYLPYGQLSQNLEFRVANGQPLALDLVLMSGEDSTFLITALVDYQQVPFTLDGQEGLLHEIEIQPGKDLFIPTTLNIAGASAHDVMFLVFKDPYLRPDDLDVRQADSCLMNGFRTVVVVGEDDHPAYAATPDAVGAPPPPGVDWGAPLLLANFNGPHPSQGAGQMSFLQVGQRGQQFPYKIWMSNLGDVTPRPFDYALVKFLNYRQAPFSQKDALFVHLDEKQEVLLDDVLLLPDAGGAAEAQLLYVVDPYQSLLRQEVRDPFVHGSGCLAIKIP